MSGVVKYDDPNSRRIKLVQGGVIQWVDMEKSWMFGHDTNATSASLFSPDQGIKAALVAVTATDLSRVQTLITT